MAQNIRLKRSAVAAKVPLTTDLALGELAINTRDGKMFFKKDVSGTQTIIELSNVGHTHAASDITSGTIATARLGSGTANSTTFLRGDNTWQTISGSGTVTSVALSAGTTGLTVSGSPITTSGTITLAGTLAVANGGTGATTAANARANLGATTVGSNLFTLTDPSAVRYIQINANNTIEALSAIDFRQGIGAGTGNGTVLDVFGTTNVVSISTGTLSNGYTKTVNLVAGHGDTVNPYASKTANHFLAAPNGTAGAPTFRAINGSDITAGTIATARLGSGTADSTTFLRGDNTWATPSGGSSSTSFAVSWFLF